MPALTEELLKARIKENPVGAYLICGEESYLVKVYTEKLSQAAVDESFKDFNLRVYNGDDAELSDIYDAVMSVPMMAESKCVLVKDLPVESFGDSEMDTIAMIVKDNPEDNCLIFTYPSSNPKKNFKELKKLFSDYGYLVDFTAKTGGEITKIIENGAKKRGKVMDRTVSTYFVTNVGSDLNMLTNELDKLCAYAKGENITKSDVDEICIKSLETKVFDMINDLVSGRFDAAFHKLNLLFANREDEYMILGAMISQYVDIYRAKAVKTAGEPSAVLGQFYESYKKSSFKLDKAARYCSNLSFGAINQCLEILENADTEMKSTTTEHRLVLERALVNLARVSR
ncbi:MAG: DNA polymerase III subunit delta [Clostridia bacterium]|nr:DNA polymerase III subunit delta [Clostridia bacterium]